VKIRARPRQLPGGGWLQVTLRGRTPAGYCADHADAPHATAEEADACWRKYLLERTLRLDARRGDSGPCKVCGTETGGTVVINGYPRDHWCPSCATVENVAQWWYAPRGETPSPA
jgi:hypothetical protein